MADAPTFSIDLSVLRLLKTRKKYERFARMVPAGTVSETTQKIINRMGEYFAVAAVDQITFSDFWPWLRTQYPKWKDKDLAFWQAQLKPIDKDNPEGYDEAVLKNLLATAMANKALDLIERWQDGKEVELSEELRTAVEQFEDALQRRVKTPDVTLDWGEMIAEDEDNTGLQWRLGCVARHLRAMRPGDFGILAMRPDRGKTTWGASEVTFMAPQLADLYPDEFRRVVWLNNEGPGRRILARIRQAALGMSNSEIRDLGAEKARKAYADAIKGEDRIVVKDIHGFSNWEVEELLRKLNPGLVVFDMIDNIQFAGQTHNGGERTDQLLEAMYQWARALGVRLDFAGIAMSQISADGESMQYPLQSHLKDSKTGKQGACDFILTGGFDPSQPRMRFIGTTKNKLKIEGATGNPQCRVVFDADRARLMEPQEVDE